MARGRSNGTGSIPVGVVCEHTFVSLSDLHHALRAKDPDQTLRICADLSYVPLRYAARVTLLLAEARDPRYKPASQRFYRRMLDEIHPPIPMLQNKKLADVLAHVDHHFYGTFAQLALGNVVGQLHRGRLLAIEFNSLPGPEED